MIVASNSQVSFGVQAGDKTADAAVKPFYMLMRRLLNVKCDGDYGKGFKELGIVLRIDGDIWHWGKSGCDNVRGRRTGIVTVDIFMPKDVWRAPGPGLIQEFMGKETRRAVDLSVRKLIELGVVFDSQRLLADSDAALAEFMQGAHEKAGK